MQATKLSRTYGWIGRHIAAVATVMLIVAVALGIVGPTIANTDEPDLEPSGGVFDTYEYVDRTLSSTSTVAGAMWLVEAADRGADVLTRDALLEWKLRSDAVRTHPVNAAHLIDRYDTTFEYANMIVGTIADARPGFAPEYMGSYCTCQLAITKQLRRTGKPYEP